MRSDFDQFSLRRAYLIADAVGVRRKLVIEEDA